MRAESDARHTVGKSFVELFFLDVLPVDTKTARKKMIFFVRFSIYLFDIVIVGR